MAGTEAGAQGAAGGSVHDMVGAIDATGRYGSMAASNRSQSCRSSASPVSCVFIDAKSGTFDLGFRR